MFRLCEKKMGICELGSSKQVNGSKRSWELETGGSLGILV